jgi:hypothetical protein
LAADFRTYGGQLPIQGGWGYTQADACVIDSADPIVDSSLPFNGVAIEYAFVERRTYEELIVRRPSGGTFSGIKWKLVGQWLFADDQGRSFDKLLFDVSAFPSDDWRELKSEFESPFGHGHPEFNVEAHERKRQAKIVHFEMEFWFDITSFYGQG